ncbi:MAG: hypothetical protein ACP5PA_00580 [Elusimicrobiales bacterium]
MSKVGVKNRKNKIKLKKKENKKSKTKLAINCFIKDFVDEINEE